MLWPLLLVGIDLKTLRVILDSRYSLQTTTVPTDRLLLQNGVDFLLLQNATDNLLLTT